jgi:uncharacterized protein YdhG (YjbR/CyaY superfamily)
MATTIKTVPAKSIDEYIAGFPKDIQKILKEVKTTIKKAIPEAEETISYNLPTFKLNGRYLIYFSAWKSHISLYPFSSAMEASMKEASEYKTSGKGTIQFPIDKPLPLGLITKIVKFRIKENLEKEKEKAQKKSEN